MLVDAHFECAVEIRAPVARVFAELSRPDRFLGLQPLLESLRELEPHAPGTHRFEAVERVRLPRLLGGLRIRNRIETELRPLADEARVEFRTRSRPGIVLRGEFRLSLAAEGTLVEERVALRSPPGLRRFVAREARRAQETLLERLRRRLEEEQASGGAGAPARAREALRRAGEERRPDAQGGRECEQ